MSIVFRFHFLLDFSLFFLIKVAKSSKKVHKLPTRSQLLCTRPVQAFTFDRSLLYLRLIHRSITQVMTKKVSRQSQCGGRYSHAGLIKGGIVSKSPLKTLAVSAELPNLFVFLAAL